MHEHWAKILKSSVCRMCIYDILLHGAMEWGRDVYLAPTCLILNGVYSSEGGMEKGRHYRNKGLWVGYLWNG